MKIFLAAAALALAGCAWAPAPKPAPVQTAPVQTAQAKQAKDDPSRKICKRMMETGSLQPKRVCSTAEEWAEFDRRAREGNDRMNELRRSGGGNGDFTGDIGGRPTSSQVNPERALH